MSARLSPRQSPQTKPRRSFTETLVDAVARTLPVLARERYREEWLADLVGARELGLAPGSIVGGAVMTALSIDRTDPRVIGISRSVLAANRLRWAAAFLGSAAILGVGSFIWGGYAFAPFVLLDFAVKIISLVFVTLGLFALLGAITVGVDVHGKRSLRILCIVPVVVGAVVVSLLLNPFLMLLGVPAAFAALIVTLSGKNAPVGGGQRSALHRVLFALPFTLGALAVVGAGALHIWVWNPLAAMPGRSLEQIYSAMRAAGESPDVVGVLAWAVFWGVSALAPPVLSAIPRIAPFFTAHRIAVLGLLTIGGAATFHVWAGFGMGMSLADAFGDSGGDAAVSGPIIAILGQIALVVALLFGPTPRSSRLLPQPAYR